MKNIINISFFVLAVAVLFSVFAPFSVSEKGSITVGYVSVYALGDSEDGGCCGSDTGTGSIDTDSTDTDSNTGDTPSYPPVCSLSASAEFVAPGDEYTISWDNSAGASYVLGGQAVEETGFITYTWNADNVFLTFTLTGSNSDGSCTDTVTVYREVPAPTCDISADLAVAADGEEFTVSWDGTPDHSTVFRVNGQIVAVPDSQTYTWPAGRTDPVTVTLTGQNASGTCEDSVTVYSEDNPPVNNLTCQDVSFTASDTTVSAGASVNLSWVFTGNVTSASLSPNVANPLVVNNVDVTVNNTMTYYMEIGNAQNTVACPLTITVTDTPDTITCADNVTFTASNYSLPSSGGDVALTWTTTGVDSINIAGVASNNLNDSEVVNVSSDRTYTLQATADGTTINCPLSIDVATSGGGGGSSSPRCDLDISDDAIKAGQEVTLSWSTSRTEEVRIEDNHGNVLVDTEDDDELDGEITIKPTKDTEFTLYAIRGTRERECEVEVEVENTVTVYESRSQEPRVAGISLTQVPYTGFEAGPALTAIFYTILTIWGLFVAYVVVIRRDRVAGVSFAGAHDHVSFTDQSVEATSTEESSVAEGYVYEATASDIPANLPTAQPLEKVVGYEQYVNNK